MPKIKKIPYILLISLIVAYLFPLGASNLSIEHARSEREVTWGLMQRRSLPENQGMLFHYPFSQKVNFWSFNCYIDLSVAFIDENKTIQEIKTLHAFPQKMDPSKPVFSYKDFNLYSQSDPIILFFKEKSIKSSGPVKYVLEVNVGWFERNQVRVGDTLHFDDSNNSAFFTH